MAEDFPQLKDTSAWIKRAPRMPNRISKKRFISEHTKLNHKTSEAQRGRQQLKSVLHWTNKHIQGEPSEAVPGRQGLRTRLGPPTHGTRGKPALPTPQLWGSASGLGSVMLGQGCKQGHHHFFTKAWPRQRSEKIPYYRM